MSNYRVGIIANFSSTAAPICAFIVACKINMELKHCLITFASTYVMFWITFFLMLTSRRKWRIIILIPEALWVLCLVTAFIMWRFDYFQQTIQLELLSIVLITMIIVPPLSVASWFLEIKEQSQKQKKEGP